MSKNSINIINNLTEIDELKLALTNNDVNHILWFSASWCGPCKLAEKHIKQIIDLYQSKTKPLVIYKLDIDNINMDIIGITDECEIKLLSEVDKLPTFLYYKNDLEQPNKRIISKDYNIIFNFLSSIDELKSSLNESNDF
jgi:thiol-disulfide isomerase/thioredoxin